MSNVAYKQTDYKQCNSLNTDNQMISHDKISIDKKYQLIRKYQMIKNIN